MPIQLLETSDDDSYLAVAQLIGDLLNDGQKTALAETAGSRFVDDCTNLLQEERFADYAARITGQLDLLLAKAESTRDTEACLNILCHAVGRVSEQQQAAVATSVAQALAKSDDHPEERVVALLNLYNVSRVPAAQHAVLLLAADFSRRNPRVSQLLGGAIKGKADTWVKEWNLPEVQTRELLLALASVMKACGDRAAAKEYVKLSAAALALARPGDAAALAALKAHAVSTLADFVRSPSIYQCDVMELPAVAQLAADKQYAGLHQLVTKMLAGDFAGVKALVTPEVLQITGTTQDAVISKARMVVLLALCVRAGHEEVPLTAVQQALDVPAEQVEAWIVRAIGAKLLEGKVDQVRGVLSVTRATTPSFGSAQWSDLSSKLASLKKHLTGALSQVANLRPPQQLAARPQAATVRAM